MNNINFNQTGGFPLDTDILALMQSSYQDLAKLVILGGDQYIVAGCEVVAGNASSGTVVINGEMLPFVGGAVKEYIVIDEIVTNKTFQDGQSKPTLYTRVAKFSDTGQLKFDTLERIPSLLDLEKNMFPQTYGEWTPTINPGWGSILNDQCQWMKTGKMLFLSGVFDLYLESYPPGVDGLLIGGFPDETLIGFPIGMNLIRPTNSTQSEVHPLFVHEGKLSFGGIPTLGGTTIFRFNITLFTI